MDGKNLRSEYLFDWSVLGDVLKKLYAFYEFHENVHLGLCPKGLIDSDNVGVV